MAINILIIGGSIQENNYTMKAALVVEDELSKQSGVSVEVIDPKNLTLPLPGQPSHQSVDELQEKVKKADGVILVTPEYHGSYSSVMKLIIDNLGFPSTLKEKPIALVGVAAGVLGAIKALEHLRSVCSHVGALVLPGPVSISGVHNEFNEDGSMVNERTEKRLRKSGITLVDYIKNHICPKHTLEEEARK